jgi:glycosyltransferase involved in cell wall biosynthesis
MNNQKQNRREDNILVLSGVRGDTRRYRTIHLYEQLTLAGVNCLLSHTTDPDLPQKICQSTVVIFHRTAYDTYIRQMLETIHRQNSLAILDVDDLVFDPSAFTWIDSPDFQDPIRVALYQEDMRRHQTTMESCQAVIASTSYLAGQVRALGKPVWVHRNAFSLDMLAISEASFQQKQILTHKVVIGYASGTPTHDKDFDIAKPALQYILRNYPETELWVIGHLDPGKDWGVTGERVKRYKYVPWRDLPGLLVMFDINLAPLVMDNPFGQSKSEIKFVEAGLVRVPTIASPTEAFAEAIHPGDNGFLAATEEEWIDAITQLVEDPESRQVIGEHAYGDALERYHPSVRSAQLITTLNQIHEQFFSKPLLDISETDIQNIHTQIDQRRDSSTWIGPEVERRPTLPQMAFYTLRHRGLKILLMQVRVYIRRFLVPIIPYKKTG